MATQRSILVLIASSLLACLADQRANGQPPNDAHFRSRLNSLESNPDDHPVFLLRLLKFKGDTDIEAFQKYLNVSVARIRELGGVVIFYGKAKPIEYDFSGSKKVFGFRPCPWDRILIERYRSRKDVLRLAKSEDYRTATKALQDIVEKTVVYALNGSPWSGGKKRSPADTMTGPPEPPSPNEAVYMLNLLKFKPGGEKIYLEKYAKVVAPLIKGTHNGKVICHFKPEQVLVGDEGYDRVILVMYPSAKAFTDMLQSDVYQEVSGHRADAISLGHLYGFSNEAAELKKLEQKR
ncbi:DUF1330 domain-containing protein [Rubinisphaera italica]|nr:DUF1330 domain-containing protein [Rubinisphaera italica]